MFVNTVVPFNNSSKLIFEMFCDLFYSIISPCLSRQRDKDLISEFFSPILSRSWPVPRLPDKDGWWTQELTPASVWTLYRVHHLSQDASHITQYTVHSTHYTLHITHFTVLSWQYAQHIVQYTLNSTQYPCVCLGIGKGPKRTLKLVQTPDRPFPSEFMLGYRLDLKLGLTKLLHVIIEIMMDFL